MIGAVRAPRKANAVTPKRFKIYEDPDNQQTIQATPLVPKTKLKEIHINIQAQKDTMRRMR